MQCIPGAICLCAEATTGFTATHNADCDLYDILQRTSAVKSSLVSIPYMQTKPYLEAEAIIEERVAVCSVHRSLKCLSAADADNRCGSKTLEAGINFISTCLG